MQAASLTRVVVLQGADSNKMLITCPMQATTRVKPLSVKTMEPLEDRTKEETSYVAWVYDKVPSPNDAPNTCDEGSKVTLDVGMHLEMQFLKCFFVQRRILCRF